MGGVFIWRDRVVYCPDNMEECEYSEWWDKNILKDIELMYKYEPHLLPGYLKMFFEEFMKQLERYLQYRREMDRELRIYVTHVVKRDLEIAGMTTSFLNLLKRFGTVEFI